MSDREQKFPLCETLQDAIQQESSQARELTHKQHTLHTLQVSLSALDERCRFVFGDLKMKERNISALLCDIEQIQNNIISLGTQTHTILLENLEIQNSIEEQLDNTHGFLAKYRLYQSTTKMFKGAVRAEEESQTDVYKELTNALQDLKEDLHNPESQSVYQAQKEIDILKTDIHNSRETLRSRKVHLKREQESHTQLRKDIQIENRRCDAIMKRLHCQLKKVQVKHRQMCADITHMEKELEDLKSQMTTAQHI